MRELWLVGSVLTLHTGRMPATRGRPRVSLQPLDRPGIPSNFSERSTSNGSRQPATAPAVGESFEAVVLPHLDAAYRLARWLTRNEHDAEDVVQDASLRGSSELFAISVLAGVAACTRQPTRSMKSGTAALDQRPTLKPCCFKPMTSS